MTHESLLTFPCAFPLKVVGLNSDGFPGQVEEIVRRHVPDFDPSGLTARPSSGGRYLALSFVIQAVSQDQLDALYRELSSHELVRFMI